MWSAKVALGKRPPADATCIAISSQAASRGCRAGQVNPDNARMGAGRKRERGSPLGLSSRKDAKGRLIQERRPAMEERRFLFCNT